MANPFVHVELQTSDVAKAREFYGKLFAWKFEEMAMPEGYDYTMIKVGEGTGGGMMKSMALEGLPPHWLAYVSVDDVAASTRKAKQLGAKILMDVTKVGDLGSMSVFTDPTGAVLALWQVHKQ